MLGSRHQTLLKEIDTARCVGQWSTIAGLATKYAKHSTAGQAFANIIICEARLEELLLNIPWTPRTHWKDEGSVMEDGVRLRTYYPLHLSTTASATLDPLEKDLRRIGQGRSMTDEEKFQLSVVLGKVCFYGGRFDACREALGGLSSTIQHDVSLSPAYGKQLYMAQMVMTGILLEMKEDLGGALRIYETAVEEFSEKIRESSVVIVPRSSAHEELVNWPEEALYRRAMMALSIDGGTSLDGVAALATYLRQMDDATPSGFRAPRRVRANRVYMDRLRRTDAAVAELARAHTRQMSLLKAAFEFPRADESHEEVLAEVDLAAEDLADEAPECLVEIMYSALSLTFNSPRVLQHLIRALELSGDYHEASLALRTYEQVAARQLEPVRKRLAAKQPLDDGAKKFVADVLQTSADGARLRVQRLGDAHGSLSLVHFAHALAGDVESDGESAAVEPHTRAQLALWKGVAHACLAQRSREPGNRSDHHSAALQLLNEAAELAPRLPDAYFHLALELALGSRNIAEATAAAKRAVALDSKRLDAWHLLALLSSARKDDAKALQICDVGMRQSAWWGVLEDIDAGREPSGFPSDVGSGARFFDLAVTRMSIDGRLRGYEASLAAHQRLFALYGCVFGPVLALEDSSHGPASISARYTPPSHTSGRRSLAKSLLSRSVFSKHSRFHSHGGARPMPPLPPLPAAEKPASPSESAASIDAEPKRQRSMPHLRSASRDGSASDILAEAYFDTASGSHPALSDIGSRTGAYFSQVPTRTTQNRRLAKRSLCLLWLTSAAAFVVLDRHDDAANAVSEALAACPDSPEALTMRGQLELSQDRHLPALNDFHAAVSLEPTNIRASVSLARVEYLLSRRDVALGLLKNTTRAHGWSDPEAWYWLGRLERELALDQESPGNVHMIRRALEYTTYALDLETSQPIRPFSILRFPEQI
ncbi:hypothetical protein GGI15_001305 [Coemansia interrupta]|uniref:Uncharacterized protein n=1 Tax=Coemansia interrupta TaxID=1126814 RepID=A0A9W8HQH9_9FUNG|nr:hypothetical protein GGI15_001305 [Coemansia interrupta]